MPGRCHIVPAQCHVVPCRASSMPCRCHVRAAALRRGGSRRWVIARTCTLRAPVRAAGPDQCEAALHGVALLLRLVQLGGVGKHCGVNEPVARIHAHTVPQMLVGIAARDVPRAFETTPPAPEPTLTAVHAPEPVVAERSWRAVRLRAAPPPRHFILRPGP
eukprot:COSAG03_NODE_118_length_12325_cov_11.481515_8_plen_161_part_00